MYLLVDGALLALCERNGNRKVGYEVIDYDHKDWPEWRIIIDGPVWTVDDKHHTTDEPRNQYGVRTTINHHHNNRNSEDGCLAPTEAVLCLMMNYVLP